MKKSELEELVAEYIKREGLPQPVREHRFHGTRLWRFDFAWLDERVALEVEGGTFMQGRHSRGLGASFDSEKYNEAARLGWIVLKLDDKLIRGHTMKKIGGRVLKEPRYRGGEWYVINLIQDVLEARS